MYNLICLNDTGNGLRIGIQLFNDLKATDYRTYLSLSENAGHKASMDEAERACAYWLAEHVKDKKPWTGYDPALLAVHRGGDRKLRDAAEHACLKKFTPATDNQPKPKKPRNASSRTSG
jgi:hypothetical protein